MAVFIPRPIRPPTGNEWTIVFWIVVAAIIGFGVVCLYLGYRAPAEKAEEAATLIRGGYLRIVGGFGLVVARRFLSR
jgi:hypothetical protein